MEGGRKSALPEALEDEVVGFRDGQFRGHDRLPLSLEHGCHGCMPRLIGIRLGVEPAGVHDERHQRSPIALS